MAMLLRPKVRQITNPRFINFFSSSSSSSWLSNPDSNLNKSKSSSENNNTESDDSSTTTTTASTHQPSFDMIFNSVRASLKRQHQMQQERAKHQQSPFELNPNSSFSSSSSEHHYSLYGNESSPSFHPLSVKPSMYVDTFDEYDESTFYDAIESETDTESGHRSDEPNAVPLEAIDRNFAEFRKRQRAAGPSLSASSSVDFSEARPISSKDDTNAPLDPAMRERLKRIRDIVGGFESSSSIKEDMLCRFDPYYGSEPPPLTNVDHRGLLASLKKIVRPHENDSSNSLGLQKGFGAEPLPGPYINNEKLQSFEEIHNGSLATKNEW